MWAGLIFCAPAAAIVASEGLGGDPILFAPNTMDSPWSGVGRLETADGKSYTAAVIGPRLIITAAHAARPAKRDDLNFLLYARGNEPYRIKAGKILVHPDYRGFTPASDGAVHDDLAIIELEQMVPFGTAIYPLLLQQVPTGNPFLMVGFGISGDGKRGVVHGTGMGHVKRVGGNVLDRQLPDDGGKAAAEVFMFDFDGPDRLSNYMGAGTLGRIEATLGEGDSGCPIFVRIASSWFLAGVGTFVTTFSNGPTQPGVFGTGGGGMLLSGYSAWLGKAISEIGGPVLSSSASTWQLPRINQVDTSQQHERNQAAIRRLHNTFRSQIPTKYSYKS